ncbi:MAG: response regulator [Cyanobacteria bacterium P01_A01_bin.17]
MSNAYRIQSIFDSDIAQTLKRLEALLATPETPEFATALKTQVAALLSWGEVLEIEGLISLAQTTVLLMRAAPDNHPMIAQLALEGFRAIYQLELLQTQRTTAPLPAATRIQSAPAPSPSRPGPTEVSSELILEQRLPTANLFLWQMDGSIFVLPSHQVVEILISKPEQLVQTGLGKSLRWRDQLIPLYQLIQPSTAQPFPEIGLSSAGGTTLRSGTILVIQQGSNRLALDIDIKLLVTESELKIIPYASRLHAPSYCHGYTIRSDDRAAPVINIALLLDQKLRLSAAPQTEQTAPPAAAQDAEPVVLVVDDSHTLRHILTITLEGIGYRVLQAQHGTEALEQLQKHQEVRLVICDVEMPQMNGFDFLSHCRRDPKMTTIPVVMLSTHSGEEHRQLSSTLGANAYFSKPYDQAQFLETLQTLIAKS